MFFCRFRFLIPYLLYESGFRMCVAYIFTKLYTGKFFGFLAPSSDTIRLPPAPVGYLRWIERDNKILGKDSFHLPPYFQKDIGLTACPRSLQCYETVAVQLLLDSAWVLLLGFFWMLAKKLCLSQKAPPPCWFN